MNLWKYKALVTGSTGLVGEVPLERLKKGGHEMNLLTPDYKEMDLTSVESVDNYFARHRPKVVFMLAAKVGGNKANLNDSVSFISENLRMQLNLFEACYKYQVKKSLFLGSSCIYPRKCLDVIKLLALGFKASIKLADGISSRIAAYERFVQNLNIGSDKHG